MNPFDNSVEKKFFLVNPCPWGLGNFQIRVITGLLISILTDRALVIQDPRYTFWKFPTSGMLLDDEDLLEYFGGNSQTAFQFDAKSWNTCRSDFENNLQNHTFAMISSKWFGGMPWYTYINPTYSNFMLENFGKYFYYFFGNFMFKEITHPDVIKEYSIEKERIFGLDQERDSKFIIGLQIRWGKGPSDFYLGNDIDIAKFWTCTVPMINENLSKGKDVRIFLATDTMFIRNQTINFFQSNHFSKPIPVFHIEDFTIRDGSDKISALVDMILLTNCDELVVTSRSTFGFIPHAQAAYNPWVVNRVDKKCFKRKNSQSGLLFRGGLWPWGSDICDSISCCSKEDLNELFDGDLI